ncbi:4'-phosphopantetheinyl transferase family protein [Clostridium folliculivorans]|uniref:4'-phosphopantetheinyl transferase domain-containing protein n=1 Tax=Clostridium folliculivorans TaxID=2886038 RepID=A0A9W5Y3H4_9CLOT|nr:4'-phosphopantetheinyl transferase superfamily protein [Clostridium folliculivorans]GKU25883.1 hypothetical protein CFOLD11_27090 [Clostridium folliculivorans]GKU27969.1 hypothetical protein CFB3_00750 [Clostridium folliculivorans]
MIYTCTLKIQTYEIHSNISHLLGQKLLTYALQEEKSIKYRDEPLTLNPWGKPSLKNHPNIHFNISHSFNCIACVISDTYAVGIDVEKIRIFNPYAAKKVCTTEEIKKIYSSSNPDRVFFKFWTLKESYIKAIGKGLSHPMKDINFEIYPDGQILSNLSECRFHLIEDTNEFITAVCYLNI